ncbi:MAG: hypothetical protein RLZZ165_560 [Bacteroidota bacterium]
MLKISRKKRPILRPPEGRSPGRLYASPKTDKNPLGVLKMAKMNAGYFSMM